MALFGGENVPILPDEAGMKTQILALVVSGCALLAASACTSRYIVRVDSLSAADDCDGIRYVVLPGTDEVAENELLFREFEAYVVRALDAHGLQAADSIDTAELVVLVDYGPGGKETSSYSTTRNVYGWVGGGTTTFQSSTIGAGATRTTMGTASQAPRREVVGRESTVYTDTTHVLLASFDAIDASRLRETGESESVWRTTTTTTSVSGDMRRGFPVMLVAASDYFCTDTQRQIGVRLSERDPRVLEVRGELPL